MYEQDNKRLNDQVTAELKQELPLSVEIFDLTCPWVDDVSQYPFGGRYLWELPRSRMRLWARPEIYAGEVVWEAGVDLLLFHGWKCVFWSNPQCLTLEIAVEMIGPMGTYSKEEERIWLELARGWALGRLLRDAVMYKP